MVKLQDVQITRIVTGSDGKFIFASYPEWKYEFGFFIRPDGYVRGRTSRDQWVALSDETTHIIREKLFNALHDMARQEGQAGSSN